MKKSRLLCAGVFCLMVSSFNASAALIDFQPLEHVDGFIGSHGQLYIEDGFQITGEALSTFGTTEVRYTGSTALFSNVGDSDIVLSKDGGGTFDLISIVLSDLDANFNFSQDTSVTFIRDGGHSQAFTLDEDVFTSQTFFFDAGFQGSTTVTWTQADDGHQFDDIQVALTSVPIPAAAWLFGSGLLGLVGMARRKKAA